MDINQGDYIKTCGWIGKVEFVLSGDGKTYVMLFGPKHIYYHQRGDLLEVLPDMMEKADRIDYEAECLRFMERLVKDVSQITDLFAPRSVA